MTSDNMLKKSIAVEATEVARKFIRIYYHTIKRDPEKSHQFYMNDSIFTRIEDGKEPNVVVGQQNIYDVLKKISYEKIQVHHVDSQDAPNGGVLIVVTGSVKLADKGSDFEDFVQTFLLNQRGSQQGQRRQFYVCNDILRYLPRRGEKGQQIRQSKQPDSMTSTEDSSSFTATNAQEEASTQEAKQSKTEKPRIDAAQESNAKPEAPAADTPVEKAPSDDSQNPAQPASKKEDAKTKKGGAATAEANAPPKPASTAESNVANGPTTTAGKKGKPKRNSRKEVKGGKWDTKKNGSAPAQEKDKSGEAPAEKEVATKAGTKSWAMRVRDSEARSQNTPQRTQPAAAPAAAAQPTQPAQKAAEKPAPGESEFRTPGQRGRGGKMKGRGGKTGKSGFNYNDPENIALTLYVSGLPSEYEKSDIEAKFGEFGKIREIQIPYPNYCFVHYYEKESVEAAIAARPISLKGEELKVDKRKPNNRNKMDHARGRGRGRGRYRHAGRGEGKV
mmetsp:Transcript_6750/g.13401  ORF Transcript_6750/g.13401 Transcript_6750/m.13401 type:complete len:502 (-) Transcript_6750:410-1915(-)